MEISLSTPFPVTFFKAASALACSFALSAYATEPPAPAPTAPQTLDKIVISGEQPGPGLWKISKGGNVLWILGAQSPMPQKLTWRAKGIEKIISQSQEILGEPGGVSISPSKIGWFTTLTMAPSLLSARENPDGKKLRDVVPAELYPRWVALRNKYIDDHSTNNEEMPVESYRPVFAALELYNQALKKNGYTQSSLVWPVIRAAAAKHNVKITSVMYEPDIKNPRASLRSFRESQLADLECFTKTMDRIETDLDNMRQRANAWAKGDVQSLRKIPAADQREACNNVFRNAQFLQVAGLQNVETEIENKWFAAVDHALEKNAVTFGVVSMRFLFSANDYLAKLKARGYMVEAPEGALE